MNIIEICGSFVGKWLPNYRGYLYFKKSTPRKEIFEKLISLKNNFKDIFFITCEHKNNYAKFYPNHKLLVLKK